MLNQNGGSEVDCSVSSEAEVQLVSTVKKQVHKFENVDSNHIIISSREMSWLTEIKQRSA